MKKMIGLAAGGALLAALFVAGNARTLADSVLGALGLEPTRGMIPAESGMVPSSSSTPLVRSVKSIRRAGTRVRSVQPLSVSAAEAL